MRHRLLPAAFAILAALCIALVLCDVLHAETMFSLLSAPFSCIGNGLRALSLSGAAGDIAAWILYLLFCLAPLVPLLVRLCRGRAHAEDSLLVILSAVLFYVLYRFINPALIAERFGAFETVGRMALSGTVFSILLAYAVLRPLRACRDRRDRLFLLLSIVLVAVAVVLIIAVFAVSLSVLLSDLDALRAANTARSDRELRLGQAFLALQTIISAVPKLFGIAIVLAALRLI